jgi:hypothetical protein
MIIFVQNCANERYGDFSSTTHAPHLPVSFQQGMDPARANTTMIKIINATTVFCMT